MRPLHTNFDDVGLFHEKFDLDNTTVGFPGPREFDPELMKFRVKFIREEFVELLEGLHTYMVTDNENMTDIVFDANKLPDHDQVFDALLDIVYVAMGTAHLLGYPWEEGWHEVQQANMKKVRASEDGSDSKRGTSFDVVKPEGWTPPDIRAVLEKYGFKFEPTETPIEGDK